MQNRASYYVKQLFNKWVKLAAQWFVSTSVDYKSKFFNCANKINIRTWQQWTMTYHTISMWLVLSVGITGTAMENTETSASEVTFVTLGTSTIAQKCQRFPATWSAAQKKYFEHESQDKLWQLINLWYCGWVSTIAGSGYGEITILERVPVTWIQGLSQLTLYACHKPITPRTRAKIALKRTAIYGGNRLQRICS